MRPQNMPAKMALLMKDLCRFIAPQNLDHAAMFIQGSDGGVGP
jgi:hypothetical protein